MRGIVPALLLTGCLLVAVVIINPLREFSPQDDGWAYAHSVQWLLQHGSYRLDAWSAANMPVQIYFAAGLATVFGYSLSLLSVSTLCMLLVALLSFYALLRELRVDLRLTFALTLTLLANPLVLMLGFSFMSDVQFLGWLCLALWLCARSLRRASMFALLAGSAAAACAIGTRQFGIALIPGLFMAALSGPRYLWPSLAKLTGALALPLAVAVWQIRIGLETPNPTQVVRFEEQAAYLAQSVPALLQEATWRVATVWRYLGIATLAAAPIFIPAALDEWRASRRFRRTTACAAVFLLGFAALGSSITSRGNLHAEVLPLWWLLPNALREHPGMMAALDAAGLGSSIFLLALVLAKMRRWRELRSSPAAMSMMMVTGVVLLAFHLVYVQLNDTYIVSLLPFGLMLVAVCAKPSGSRPRHVGASAGVSLLLIVALSLWFRGQYNLQETQWRAAEELLAADTQPKCIGGIRHWSEYHGAFDEWLAAGQPDKREATAKAIEADKFHAPFYDWLVGRADRATFRISRPNEPGGKGWKIKRELSYRNWLQRRLSIFVYERIDPVPLVDGHIDGRDEHCPP